MALIRPGILAALIYLAYVIAFPDYTDGAYHVIVPAAIAGGTVGLFMLKKVLGLVEGTALVILEIVFLISVALFLGYTMPQKTGKAPLEQWAAGARPTQDAARRGFDRLGVNPNGPAAAKIVSLFPKK